MEGKEKDKKAVNDQTVKKEEEELLLTRLDGALCLGKLQVVTALDFSIG